MKKYIGFLLLVMALLMAGCGKQPSAAPTASAEPPAAAPTEAASAQATPEPAPMEPEGVPGTVLLPHLGAVLGTLPVGEQVSVVSEQDGYCLVETSVGQGFIEKRLLRLVGEPAFESYDGYAKYGAVLYEGYQMLDNGIPLNFNAKLTVLEAFGGGFMVQLEDEIGYVAADMLSQWPITSGGGSGGSGGGSSGGNDGGDISLTAAEGTGAHVRLLAGAALATVLVDDAQVYAAFLNRNDAVKVTEATDETCTIYLDGSLLTLPRRFVALEGDAAFESYTGYARSNAGVYTDYTMIGDPGIVLKFNEEITVLGDFGRFCLVEAGGTLGFMKPDAFNKQPAAPGGSGGGSGEQWTPPIL